MSGRVTSIAPRTTTTFDVPLRPATPSALPALPAPALLDATQDDLAKLFAILVAMQRERGDSATTGVRNNDNQRKVAQETRDAALAKAERESEKGGVFDWISKDIGLLGVAGLATFNYGLVAADLALHKSGAIDNLKLDVADAAIVAYGKPELVAADILLRKLDVAPDDVKKELHRLGLDRSVPGVDDEDVKPIVDKAIAVNLMVAGAAASVLSAGTTTALVVALVGVALSASAMASQEAGGPEWLSLGLHIAGAGCSLGAGLSGGVVGTAAASRVAAAKTASLAANGLNSGLSGADTIVQSVHQHASSDASEGALAAKNALARLERLLDGLIDVLQDSESSRKRTTETVQQTLTIHNDTLALSASAMKG